MTNKNHKLGVISYNGMINKELSIIEQSRFVKSVSLYQKTETENLQFDKTITETVKKEAAIFEDPDISIIILLTTQDHYERLFKKAIASNKHIVIFNPLAQDITKAKKLNDLVQCKKINCGVIHKNTDENINGKLKKIFTEDEIGKLVIYKIDKFCKPLYGEDENKNNLYLDELLLYYLDKSRYLIDGDILSYNFYSQGDGQVKKNQETDFLKINFDNGASAHIFITWTNDVDMYNGYGNEMMGSSYMITQSGWYVTVEKHNGSKTIKAYKQNNTKEWTINEPLYSSLDTFIYQLNQKENMRYDINRALENMKVIHRASIGKSLDE